MVGPQVEDAGDWLLCCCPFESNNYDCGDLPACAGCRESGGGTYTDPGCVRACTAIGESRSYFTAFCTLRT